MVFSIYYVILLCFVLTKSDYMGGYLPNNYYKNYFIRNIDWRDIFDQYKSREKVEIQLYYEVFCPHCRTFDVEQFRPVVEKLSQYLNICTYPYGNADTIEKDGQIDFICQHGPEECYGNKLHACALDVIQNKTTALIYNTCMMEYSHSNRGSDDTAAETCGKSMSIDSNPIIQCAKSSRGSELLKYHGAKSKIANFKHVPHVLINGVKNDGKNFMKDVCAAFSNPPPECGNLF